MFSRPCDVSLLTWFVDSEARKNMTFMLPSPLPPVDHIRVITTSEGDVFVTEKRKPPCVEYIAQGRPQTRCFRSCWL